MNNNEGFGFLDLLTILSFGIGVENLRLNKQQVEQLMNEMTSEQNAMLKKIIEQNEEIISLLKEKKK